jgi:hypothetical protein
VDLAFETDLLYLDVNTMRIGIKSDAPAYELDINGTTRSTTLRGGRLVVDDVVVNDNLISTEAGDLKLGASTLSNNVVATTNFLPDLTDTYNIGSSLKRWNQAFFASVTVDGIAINTTGGSVPLISNEIDKIYVQLNGSDTAGNGTNLSAAYRTLKHALSQATSGQTISISPGVYLEEFPLTVPQGVSVIGSGLRATTIIPTALTSNKDCFLLNGETTIQDLTIKGMFYDAVNNTGYGFRFAPGCVVNQRSPYVERITLLNRGSVTTTDDPYGFQQGDAGRGALLDGAVVSRSSIEAAILFNECTFFVPNSRALIMTNGSRTEWLNCFTYFADLAVEGVVGATGRGGDGKTYLKLENVTGSFNIGDTISYYDNDGVTVLASAVIQNIVGDSYQLDGSVPGFKLNSDRSNKPIILHGDAQLSTAQKKFGVSSLALDGTSDYISISSSPDFAYGTDAFTIEMWVYRTVSGITQLLLDQRTTNPTNYAPVVFINASNALQYNNGNSSVIIGATTVPLNDWSHVAVSRSGTSTRLFLNGVQQGSTYTDANNYIATPISIGMRFDGATQPFTGYIDELRISKGIARYTSNFTVETTPFAGDSNTRLLLHFEGFNASTVIVDDGNTTQDIRSSSGGSATGLVRYDRAEFAAEMRSISGAFVYGNKGIEANGPDVVLQLMAHNFAYIGTGFDLTNNKASVIQANEVIELNSGRVYYNSVDQEGNYRIGDLFLVDFDTGAVTFQNANFDVTTLNGITFTDGTNTTIINPTGVETGNIVIAGNTISSKTGQIILDPSGNQSLVVNSPMTVVDFATFNNNVEIKGGDLITDQTTFNLLNSNATTVNFAGAATTISIGAVTGTTTINNNLQVAGTLNVDGQVTLASVNVEDLTDGRVVLAGASGELEDSANLTFDGTTLTVTGDIQVTGDVNIDGGDITTDQTTFNLLNTTATTINAFGAGTDIQIGASTGTTNINNNLDVDGDINIDGGDLTVSTSTFNIANTTATTVNFAGAGTDIQIGASTGTTNINNNLDVDGDANIDGGDLTSSSSTFNLLNTSVSTVNAFGDASIVSIGSNSSTVTLNQDLTVKRNVLIQGNYLSTDQTSFYLLDNAATTISAFGAAETLVFASSTGTTTFRSDVVINNDLQIKGGDLTTNASTFNLLNADASTINFGGAASTITVGAIGGNTSFKGNLDVDGDINVDGGDLTVSTSIFNLVNDTATTVNFAGAATDIQIGSSTGTTNINNNLAVDGQTTLSSINVLDLTSGRIVLAGVNGELEDNSNLVFDGTKLTVTGDAEITGDLTIGGNLTLGNQDTDTITVTADFTSDLVPDVTDTYSLGTVSKQWQSVFATSINFTEIDNGTIKISGNVIETIVADTDLELKPAADGRVVINSTTALGIPKGTEVERPDPAEVGDVRFNTDSARVENYNGDQWNTMTNEDDAIAFAIALG